jgi:hypothetical protein
MIQTTQTVIHSASRRPPNHPLVSFRTSSHLQRAPGLAEMANEGLLRPRALQIRLGSIAQHELQA